MWTVTLLLKPVIVTAHLLGGLATMALLWWMALATNRRSRPEARARAAHVGRHRPGRARRCRSCSAAGSAPTTPPWRARISRPASARSGRPWISRTPSCCGAGSASTTRAGCSITRRASRSIHPPARRDRRRRSCSASSRGRPLRTGQSRGVRMAGAALGARCCCSGWSGRSWCSRRSRCRSRPRTTRVAALLVLCMVALLRFLHPPRHRVCLLRLAHALGRRDRDRLRREARAVESPSTMNLAGPNTVPGAAATWRDYYELGKPRVVALIVFTAVVGMFLAVPGTAAVAGAALRHARHRARRLERGGDQPRRRPPLRREDGAHDEPADPDRPRHDAAGAHVCRDHRHRVDGRALAARESAHGRAHVPVADRLRGALHGLAQARDAAEHRDRRRGGRRAAGARLDGRHGLGRSARAAAVPDHLRLDAAALLGARDRATQRLREGRHSDAARRLRRRVHAAAHPAVHDHPVHRDAAAVPDGHERPALPRGGDRAQRDLHAPRHPAATARTRPNSCPCRCSDTRSTT